MKRFIKEKNRGARHSLQRVPLFFRKIKIYAKTSSSDGIAGMAPWRLVVMLAALLAKAAIRSR